MTLSPRQQQVVALVAAGLGNDEIADRLGLCFGTVRFHLDGAYNRTGCRNRVELAVHYVRHIECITPSANTQGHRAGR
jgi:DNA-binding NarL/FixJ family response regulator